MSLIKAITSSSFATSINKGFNNLCYSIGDKFEKSPKKDTFTKVLNKIEPTGANNSFPALLALMIGAVVLPRVTMALKRNPDDKEATMDEIKEILFRDIQTIVIILLATNAIAAGVSGKMSNKVGFALTDKPFEKVFDSDQKGLKGFDEKVQEFVHNPIDKSKKFFKNLVDLINPMGGINAYTNEQIVSKYSGFDSIAEAQKLFNQIAEEKGDKNKVFNTVMDSLIEKQNAAILNAKNAQLTGDSVNVDALEKVLNELNEVKAQGVDELLAKNDDALKAFENSAVGKQLVNFFKDKENKLVTTGTNTNGVLKMAAFAFNILYLGFGLPMLNEKRLERKYLKEQGPDGVEMQQANLNTSSVAKLTNEEKNIFASFIK